MHVCFFNDLSCLFSNNWSNALFKASTALLTRPIDISNFASKTSLSPAIHDTSFIETSTLTLVTSIETATKPNSSDTFQTASVFTTMATTLQTTENSTYQSITFKEQTILSTQPTNAGNAEQILDVSSFINLELQQSCSAMN